MLRSRVIAIALSSSAAFGFAPTATTTFPRTTSSRRPAQAHVRQSTASAVTAAEDPNPIASVKELDALVPRKEIIALSKEKSNLRGTQQVFFHFAVVALAASLPFPPLSLVATAFVSSFYFNGMHEMVHRTAFRPKFINIIFAHIFGFLCLRPARHYYYYHWQHHKYTGDVNLDSELQPGLLDFPVDTPMGYMAYLSGVPFWIDAILTTVKHAFGICPEAYLPSERARKEVSSEARIYLLLYGLIAAISLVDQGVGSLALRLWVLPAIIGQPFLRFYLLAEHRGRKNSNLIYENTRTMTTNWLYRNLAWHMPYHMEHHAWPTVPFHQLRNAHNLLLRGMCSSDLSGEEGEQHTELLGRKGYLSFNAAFVLRLLLRKKSKIA